MSGFSFDYSQGFAGNQQQPNQPIRQAVRYIPKNFNNMNPCPAFHGQPVGNWPMDQAVGISGDFGNSNNTNFGSAFHGQPVDNWPMDQAQPNMPLTPGMPTAHTSSFASYGRQMPTAPPGHTQSGVMPMGPAQSMPFDAMSMKKSQAGMMNHLEQRHTGQMQGATIMGQAMGTQNSSMQYPNMQYPGLQQSPGMYFWAVKTPGMQTTHMRAKQQQSCNISQRPRPQSMQRGRNSGPGKRPRPRPPSVINPLIKAAKEKGKLLEGDIPALKKLNATVTALVNERHKYLQGEKMRKLRSEDEAARQSRRRLRETVDHLESSLDPKRLEKAVGAAAAHETSSEPSSGESRHEFTFSPDVAANKMSPATSAGKSGHEFTLSPAAAAVPRLRPGAVCINPSALATTTTIPEPIQQKSSTKSLMLPPGAVCINPSALATTTTIPELIQQQSLTNSLMLPPGAVCINPSALATTTTIPELIQQQSLTNSLMLPPGAVFTNPSAAAAAAAATIVTPASAAAAAAAAAAEAQADATANAAENAADFIRLAPLLQVINRPEDTDEQCMIPETTGVAEEEHLSLSGPTDDLLGDEHVPPMDQDFDLFGENHVPPSDPNDELFLNTVEYRHGQTFAEMLAEDIERRQAEAAIEDPGMW